MTRKPSEVLQAARARIELRSQWCQNSLHRGDRSCALGALDDVGVDIAAFPSDPAREMLEWSSELIADERGGDRDRRQGRGFWKTPAAWLNDTVGHAAVLAAYDIAISMALSDEAAHG